MVGDVIFEGLVFGDGWSVTANIGTCFSAPSSCVEYVPETAEANKNVITENIILQSATTKVVAAPNPYNNIIRFTLESNVSGNGSLELYNMLGQKVKTVYQGYIIKGQKRSIEYDVPDSQRNSLIWVFNVGTERTTGKLIGLK